MTRRKLFAAMLAGTVPWFGLGAQPTRPDEDPLTDGTWDPLFDGPPIGKRCVVGAMDRPMRFRPANDLTAEWLVLGGVELAPDNPWNALGRWCVDLNTAEVRLWGWDDEVIRVR